MAVDLPAVLDALRARTGARSVRVVDGRVGAVVAVSGDPGTADPVDGPSAVARSLQDSRSDPGADGRGDVCVRTAHSVHLLRPVAGAPEAFVHLRLTGAGAEQIDRARATLAEPVLHELVRSALRGTAPGSRAVPRAPGRGPVGEVRDVAAGAGPVPRDPDDPDDPDDRAAAETVRLRAVPAAPPRAGRAPADAVVRTVDPPAVRPAAGPPAAGDVAEQPALAALVAARARSRDAALAAAAVAGLSAALPRRAPVRVAGGSDRQTGRPRLLRRAGDGDPPHGVPDGPHRPS